MRADGFGGAATFGHAGMLALAAALSCTASAAGAQDDDVVKIGVLNDMSGLYADIGGAGSVAAAKLAVEDFNKACRTASRSRSSAPTIRTSPTSAPISPDNGIDADHVDVDL